MSLALSRIQTVISLSWLLLLASACSSQTTPNPTIVGAEDSLLPSGDDVSTQLDLRVTPDIPDNSCSSDKQCGDYHCDVEAGTCVECLINAHCPPGFRCEEQSCIPKPGGCTSDAECVAAGLICDVANGTCVECVESTDCPTGEYCLEGKCLEWMCTPDAKWCNGTTAMGCNSDGSALALTEQCDDQSLCTQGDACVNGECAQGTPKLCDDGNPCTTDGCDAETGCYYQNSDGDCDDGTDCTEGDHCEAGQCVPGDLVCDCLLDSDCKLLNDDDLCNGSLHCVNGFCIIDPTTKVTCDTSEDPCLTISCNPGSGECMEIPVPDGEECDDGSACTQDDVCQDGTCEGTALDCDDSNPCTVDGCLDAQGCINAPTSGGNCDDGSKCTSPDTCKDGVCIGTKIDCEDGNPCTANKCLPNSGCHSEVLSGPCEDGDLCTTNDECLDSVCKGVALVCEDDGNFCTNDYCDPAVGCVHEPNTLPCDDGNACTLSDHCVQGECVPGELLFQCDDNNPCTTDSCNADSGECIHTANAQPCDDGDPCTEGDSCANTICIPGAPKDCDDSNVCTQDQCNAQGKCVNAPAAGSCEDGNACTTGDSCVGGSCQPGQPQNCNDQNPCTADSCDAAQGCLHVPNQAACNDGNACTLGDACVDGACAGSSTLDCNDDNPCTTDSCDPDGGCVNLPHSEACDDGNACTKGDYCAAGICISGQALICDDDNVCTDDSCDVDAGCQFLSNNELCEDGDPCTFNDQCSEGACTAGTTNDCSDGNVCTQDVCNFDGCLHPPADGLCDDGDPCTLNDGCSEGLCQGQPLANCGCHSLGLDGLSSFGLVPGTTALDLPVTFTVEAWFKAAPNAVATAPQSLLCRWQDAGVQNRSFCLQLAPNKQLSFVLLGTAGGNTDSYSVTTSGVNLEAGWHHVAAVYDSEQLRIYLDGKLDGTTTAAVQPTSGGAASLYLGARFDADTNGIYRHFAGHLDEVRISKAALYSGESFEPQTWLAVQANTLAYWGADQNQFSHLFDLGGQALHAALSGPTTWSDDTPADICVPRPNFPPSAPVVSISPPNPSAADNLTCNIDVPSQDMENDPITYTYQWYKKGGLAEGYTNPVLPSSATTACPLWDCGGCETWTCKVTPHDANPGPAAIASKKVGVKQCKSCPGAVWQTHCYVTGSNQSWGDANATCKGYGGTLVTIDGGAENGYIDGLCSGKCWIGLSDAASEGNFVWADGTPFGAYTNWRWQQPNDGGWFGSEDCVAMCENCGWGGDSGQWQDDECSDAQNFVCELKP